MCLASGVLIGLLAPNEAWAIPGIIGSAAGAAALVLYGRYFLKRYRNVLPVS